MNQIVPDKEAYWLWPEPNYNAQNSYAGFRHDFELKTLPSAAPFLITADQNYRLWVNGQYVCRGPLRSHQNDWYYDTVELLPYLKIGKNWISVEAHNSGCSHLSYMFRDRAGFLCSANWDNGTTIVSRRSEWLMFRNTAYNPYTGRNAMQLGYQSELDLRADDRSWITEAENYKIPPVAEWYVPCELPQGSLPWTKLSPRPTEMLEEKLMPPAEILAYGKGKCDNSPSELPFSENNFIRHFVCKELDSIQYSETLPDSVRKENTIAFSIPGTEPNTYSAVLLDMGRLEWLPGIAEMEVDSENPEAILDLAFLHHLPEPKIMFTVNPLKCCMVSLGARFHLRKGHNVFSTHQIYGTRYAVLILRGNPSSSQISFRWRCTVSPIHKTGNFQCSDSVLNEIYGISVHTQQCCAMDSYVDTPWREQAQWWGDARVQSKNIFFLSGDSKLLGQGIHSIAGYPGPEGLLYALRPSCEFGPILPDYCLTWIQTLYDFYFHTGRTDLFKEMKPKCEQIFGYFERQRGEDGLIRYDRRFWLFEDWSTLPKRNTPTFLNLLYFYTRGLYQQLLEVSGFHAEAEQLKNELERERVCLVHAFLAPETGLLVPEINEKGERTGVPSVHDQVLALLCDLCPEQNETMLKQRILPCLQGKPMPDAALPSSYWATYLLQAAQKFGLIRESLEYLRRGWEPMIPAGTAWEGFTNAKVADYSVCHAWSGHPVYHLPELFFGLRQTAPCWKSLELQPHFLAESASLVLPVPGGFLKSSWKDGVFHLELPAGIHAELHLPEESLNLDGPVIVDKKISVVSPKKEE